MNNAVTSAGHKYYLITEQQIASLKHDAIYTTNFEIAMGIVIGALLSFIILSMLELRNLEEKITPSVIISIILFSWLSLLDLTTRSRSEETWQDIKQQSEDISEKKQKKGTP
ncbi:hypothetical protein ME1_00793 [Bartonella vinsonii subsp. arupensis OK-94-513]|uniref:Uncharacterized protein n=1 Tax=Bartonella vinsonii subsp. arupensis OK-94-513 TaxID=1094562 RepID=J1JTA2_BARVI|nr:hypothetical protein [Bartonella vinsonii]EJF88127.1 hypothetical protein ME1_00793 [Bartonella vinsonii subsp. arupensis OK-94-513]